MKSENILLNFVITYSTKDRINIERNIGTSSCFTAMLMVRSMSRAVERISMKFRITTIP